MDVKALREYLADFPDAAKVDVVVDNYPAQYSMAWGGKDGGTKATAHEVCFMVGGYAESPG